MRLSDDEVEESLFCVNELISLKNEFGRRVFDWQLRLGRRFNTASLMSSSGLDNNCGAEEFDAERLEPDRLIGSIEAARILEMSREHVGRIATDLDGEKVGRDWIFRLSTVTEYAEEKRDGQSRRGVRGAPQESVGRRLGRSGESGADGHAGAV